MKLTKEQNVTGAVPVCCEFTRLVPVDELKPHPRNPNKHPPKQLQLLGEIIKFQGWRHPILVSNLSGYVVTGHARLEVARMLGIQSVPVDFQDFASEEAEIAHLIADNKIPEFAQVDKAELATLIKELEAKDFDVSLAAIVEDLTGEKKAQAEFPIVPKILEGYDCVVVFTTNDTDFLYLKTLFGLETVKSYKKTGVGTCRAVPFNKFMEVFHASRNTVNGPSADHDNAPAGS